MVLHYGLQGCPAGKNLPEVKDNFRVRVYNSPTVGTIKFTQSAKRSEVACYRTQNKALGVCLALGGLSRTDAWDAGILGRRVGGNETGHTGITAHTHDVFLTRTLAGVLLTDRRQAPKIATTAGLAPRGGNIIVAILADVATWARDSQRARTGAIVITLGG